MKTYTQRAFAARLAGILNTDAEPVRAKLKVLKKKKIFMPVTDNGERKGDVYTDDQIPHAVELLSKSRVDEINLFAESVTHRDDREVWNLLPEIDELNDVDDDQIDRRAEMPFSPPVTPVTGRLVPNHTFTPGEAENAPVDVPGAAERVTLPFFKGEPATADVVTLDERADRIRRLQADVQRGIIAIGFELIAAKQEVGHGHWKDWLKSEFAWTQQTANRFMRVADRFGKLKNVVQFQPSTLQAMLALPTGDEQDFIDAQAESGRPVEKLSAREVQRAVKQWNQRKDPVKSPALPTEYQGDATKIPGTYCDLTGRSENAQIVEELNTPTDNPLPLKKENLLHTFRLMILQTDTAELPTLRAELAALIRLIDTKI